VSNRFLFLAAGLLLFFPVLAIGADGGFVETFIQRFENFADDSTNRFVLLGAIALATFVSEDLACIAAGLLAAKQIITPFEAVAASAVGIYVGDILLYLAGYLVGITALNHAPLKYVLTKSTVDQCRRLFERRGMGLIFMSRFIPGTRTATFFAAGLVRVALVRLLVVFGIAVLLWTPVLVLGAMFAGKQVLHYVDIYSTYAIWVFIGLLLVLYLMAQFVMPLFTWRGRRLLLGKWRRLTQWEFWPYWITNTVTFAYVLYLGLIKYRKPTMFTVVNPSMAPDGGFIGESKSAILQGLPEDVVGRWALVKGSDTFESKCSAVKRFMTEHSLTYPVVLKPDRGQRGQDVTICRSETEVRDSLHGVENDFIVMEFLEGEEFGVFYYRFPSDNSGVIYSINRKKLLFVTGDGERTLEELILRDERALCLAPMFFEELRESILEIVPLGEHRQIVQVGAHCRGTLFLDGRELITEELHQAIERIVQQYDGFYFGRFDLKVPSEKELKSGTNLKVIELNGLTSEATHIYDPKNSLLVAWRTLMEQWAIAFKISSQNLQRGYEPMGAGAFLKHWIRGGTP
jgi:membrane protein DedA with SNARE-associated domain